MARLLALTTLLASALAVDPFNWHSCPGVADPQVQCGSLDVPLNYKDPSNPATIAIAVRRYRSSATTPLGTILVNPGGPGVGGSQFANAQMAFILGDGYDVLGFDPRGLGESREVKCSRDGATAAKEVVDLSNLLDPFDTEFTDAQFHHVAAHYALSPARCKHYDGDYLPYLSTAFVARDMDRIRAALGQDLTHYYGVSYGTVLGVIYANLFPSRIGRFVLDSVVDATVYTGATPKLLSTAIVDMETIFEAFGAECEAAGPTQCPLATAHAQRPYVAKKLRALFASTDANPMIVPGGDDITLLTGRDLRTAMLPPMYAPSLWPSFATYAAAAIQGNVTGSPIENVCTVDASSSRLANMGFGMYLAHDGDLSAAATWARELRAAKEATPIFAPIWFSLGLPAKAWTTRPVERYAGPWNARLQNKILILNNELDPVTPLRSAKHTADLLGRRNAVLVTRQGYGHGAAFSQPSKCIHDVVVSFMNNGSYPSVKYCKVDTTPFAPPQARSALDDKLVTATEALSAQIVDTFRLF